MAINTTKNAYNEMLPKWMIIDDLLNGTDAIVKGGNKYLPQGNQENDLSFKTRLKFSSYQDNFNTTISGVAGLIFNKPVTYTNLNPKLEYFVQYADGANNHLDLAMVKMFSDALAYGIGYVLVDIPPKGSDATVQNKPFLTHIDPKNIINWKTEIIDGKTILNMVVIKEYVEVDVDEFDTEVVERYRVLNRGTYRLYQTNTVGKVSTHALIEEGETGLDYIPLFNINLSNKGTLETEPPFYELGLKNIELYRLETDTAWNYHNASVPMLTAVGFDGDDLKKLTISSNTIITSTEPDAKIAWLDYDAKALQYGKTMADDLRLQIAQMGMGAIAGGKVEVTATQSILDNIKTQSKLFTYARKLEDTTELILKCAADMLGLDSNIAGTVNIDIDSIKGGLDVQEMQVLSNMVGSGQISIQTMWDILLKYDKLPAEFDGEVEQERISQVDLLQGNNI